MVWSHTPSLNPAARMLGCTIHATYVLIQSWADHLADSCGEELEHDEGRGAVGENLADCWYVADAPIEDNACTTGEMEIAPSSRAFLLPP